MPNTMFSRAKIARNANNRVTVDPINPIWIAILIYLCIALVVMVLPKGAHAQGIITECSYYTVESCMKESGQAIMANGRRLENDKFTCASWDYAFGQRLLITNISDLMEGKQVIAIVTDRGPSKRLYKAGRRLDVSKSCFKTLTGGKLDCGILKVKIEKI